MEFILLNDPDVKSIYVDTSYFLLLKMKFGEKCIYKDYIGMHLFCVM